MNSILVPHLVMMISFVTSNQCIKEIILFFQGKLLTRTSRCGKMNVADGVKQFLKTKSDSENKN